MSSPVLRIDLAARTRTRVPSQRLLGRWAAAALGSGAQDSEIAVQVVTQRESRRLNHQYRGKDKPTNVLSFPTTAAADIRPRPLGDLVICAAVLRREAREQGKSERAHWAHLVVHGVLHLAGYDHERDRDARRMERREISVLRTLGYANPYLPARQRRA